MGLVLSLILAPTSEGSFALANGQSAAGTGRVDGPPEPMI